MQPPEPTSGLQQVHDLADFLIQLRSSRTLSRSLEDTLIGLWEKLEPHDQKPAVFQPRMKTPPKSRFQAAKTGKGPVSSNVEKTKS
jgi:hypothetical protein